jgi:type IV pilus assembly protein PilO
MEKFKGLAWHIQLLILVGIASVLYLTVWYFVTSETRAEVQTLNDQIGQLKSQNEAAKVATQRINEFRSLFAAKTQEYDELKVLLPEEREITNVLQGLQDTANESQLIVMRFSPRDDSQQEFIMAKPVEIEVDSNFNNLRAFFEKMAKLQRIVSITDFKLNQLEKQTGERTLHAQFLLTAYYASPENLNSANAQPQTPGQPPVNGQPTSATQPVTPPAQPPVAQ